MLHRRIAIAGVLVMMVLAAHPAFAGHCARFTTSTTGGDVVVVPAAGAGQTSYAVADASSGFYVYAESNGIAGLQRHDPGHSDTCHGQIASDTRTL